MALQPADPKYKLDHANVADGRLAHFEKGVGYFRDGYCRTSDEDPGNHSVAATVTKEFLDFSASKGNNLKDKGIKPGQKWCLCATRWKEAFDAAQEGALSKEAVPKVNLNASHKKALDNVSYKQLKQYSVGEEAVKEGVSQRQNTVGTGSTHSDRIAKDAGSKKDSP